MPGKNDLDALCINTIRTLSMDAVQAANSGHPGTPMALAPVAYCLWQQFLRFDPQDPIWPNRDRFILSNGHASMLLYSLLYLSGVRAMNPTSEPGGRLAVTLDDIKTFRQAGSRCTTTFGCKCRMRQPFPNPRPSALWRWVLPPWRCGGCAAEATIEPRARQHPIPFDGGFRHRHHIRGFLDG